MSGCPIVWAEGWIEFNYLGAYFKFLVLDKLVNN